MTIKYKVWGMCVDGRKRYIVAARNQKDAAAAMGVTLHALRTYASETGNEKEIRAAMSDIGVKVLSPSQYQ